MPAEVKIEGACVRFTGRAEGDLGPSASDPAEVVEARRHAVYGRQWSWVRQVHGAEVVVVNGATPVAGPQGDVLVTGVPRRPLAVFTADCAPVGLVGTGSSGPVVAAVHAGWRGLVRGVVDAAAAAVRECGGTSLRAAVGPTIHPECYAFSPRELAQVTALFGDTVAGRTAGGDLALDVPETLRVALARAEIDLVYEAGECTACDPGLFSHRARGDRERQAMVIWRE